MSKRHTVCSSKGSIKGIRLVLMNTLFTFDLPLQPLLEKDCSERTEVDGHKTSVNVNVTSFKV